MSRHFSLLSALFFVCVSVTSVKAQSLFDVSATGGTTTVNTGSSSLIGLEQSLANNDNQFAPLKNQNFTSTLDYAGIKNAFLVDQTVTSNGTRLINFQVPSVGINQTFSSANGSLSTQIKNYLKKDGLADLTEFQAVVDRQSPAGVIDGNPMAATALLADTGYYQYAPARKPVRFERPSICLRRRHRRQSILDRRRCARRRRN